jgi:hypothetical protein
LFLFNVCIQSILAAGGRNLKCGGFMFFCLSGNNDLKRGGFRLLVSVGEECRAFCVA